MITLKEGDPVTRMLAGSIPMPLQITEIEDGIIHCGSWKFDAISGAEIDEDCNWGPPPLQTGSYLKEIVNAEKTPDDAFVEEFPLSDGTAIAAVVVNEPEFCEVLEQLKGVFIANMDGRLAQQQFEVIKKAKVIPVIVKGAKTQFFFDKYNLTADKASMIVRGQGAAMVEKIKSVMNFNPENN